MKILASNWASACAGFPWVCLLAYAESTQIDDGSGKQVSNWADKGTEDHYCLKGDKIKLWQAQQQL